MSALTTEAFLSFDGVRLALHSGGRGRPVLLLHGFLADAQANWVAPGIAQRLIDAGFRVIAPDLRGHGASEGPPSPEAWPSDVLVDDQLALIRSLGLTDYDLVGYSLGARTAARMMVRGARPGRAVLGGMGASGVMRSGPRAEMFEDALLHGEGAKDPAAGRRIQAIVRRGGLDVEAMLGVLRSFVPTEEAELRSIPTPTLALAGTRDQDNGSVEELAALLPRGSAERIEGDHLSVVANPAFADAVLRGLEAGGAC